MGSVSSSQTILLKHQINTFKELHFGRLETALHMRLAGECDICMPKTKYFGENTWQIHEICEIRGSILLLL